MSQPSPQASDAVLMVRPVRFGFNAQTAASNAFQHNDADSNSRATQLHALKEFNSYVATLKWHNIEVLVVEDTQEPHTPDSIFPNNWLSTHKDGRVVLYPMEAQNRRQERRADIVEALTNQYQYHITEVIDISHFEAEGKYLEGTGSLVIDYPNRIAYACHSSRTHPEVVEALSKKLGFEAVWFHGLDPDGQPIYHTNVMMAIAEKYAIVCLDAIPETGERDAVVQRLQHTGHDVIDIAYHQLLQFAGNMFEVADRDGKSKLIMSRAAYLSLTPAQIQQIENHSAIIAVDISTIENYGGGSARCMVAGIRLPKN